MALTLAKEGYFGGSIEQVFNSRVDYVVETFHYETFLKDYNSAFAELNSIKD